MEVQKGFYEGHEGFYNQKVLFVDQMILGVLVRLKYIIVQTTSDTACLWFPTEDLECAPRQTK